MTIIYLKNPATKEIVAGKLEGFGSFFDSWEKLSEKEILAYKLKEVQKEKISEIKSTAAFLILAAYPIYKQLNILMSKDAKLIEEMNEFILAIRTKSNQLEAALDLLSDPEEIKNFPTQFTL
jgi:cell division protein FtsL